MCCLFLADMSVEELSHAGQSHNCLINKHTLDISVCVCLWSDNSQILDYFHINRWENPMKTGNADVFYNRDEKCEWLQ